ncbi:hypothetical protein Pmani_019705 [Petrolisthes manimaculis]|uniref:Uncharacterized protein n=1 Tax=Petrolisthes manimaculis TaxID=1843537 RepID=A0AAE1PHZ3_9EUCA|nr:hypothetical protein Pmani_019705 [Petrolisthes manimaculis]
MRSGRQVTREVRPGEAGQAADDEAEGEAAKGRQEAGPTPRDLRRHRRQPAVLSNPLNTPWRPSNSLRPHSNLFPRSTGELCRPRGDNQTNRTTLFTEYGPGRRAMHANTSVS